jgi:hypothetical protein
VVASFLGVPSPLTCPQQLTFLWCRHLYSRHHTLSRSVSEWNNPEHCFVSLPIWHTKILHWKKDNFFTTIQDQYYNLNSVALARKQTIPTEWPPLVGEVSANFLRVEGFAWSAQRIPTAVNLGFLDWSRYFFIQVAPQLSSQGWVDPILLRKSGRAGNRTRDLWICSQKLSLDHKGEL